MVEASPLLQTSSVTDMLSNAAGEVGIRKRLEHTVGDSHQRSGHIETFMRPDRRQEGKDHSCSDGDSWTSTIFD